MRFGGGHPVGAKRHIPGACSNMNSKPFDCIQMKDQIQQRLLAELRGLSPVEQRRRTEEIIRQDPLLRRVWKSAPRVGASHRNRPAAAD
jgi:hypothetical protein